MYYTMVTGKEISTLAWRSSVLFLGLLSGLCRLPSDHRPVSHQRPPLWARPFSSLLHLRRSGLLFCRKLYWTGLVRVPMPSISTVISSPAFRWPTPTGVPL